MQRLKNRWLLLFISLLLTGITGCGSSKAEKGQELANQGVQTSNKMSGFYTELTDLNSYIAQKETAEELPSVSSTPDLALTATSGAISERAAIETSLQSRKEVAEAMKASFATLQELSKFDISKTESAASDMANALNKVGTVFGIPPIPVKLFAWLQTEIVEAKKARSIERGANAMRWAVSDLVVLYEVEMGTFSPNPTMFSKLTEDIYQTPGGLATKHVYPEIPNLNYGSTAIFPALTEVATLKVAEALIGTDPGHMANLIWSGTLEDLSVLNEIWTISSSPIMMQGPVNSSGQFYQLTLSPSVELDDTTFRATFAEQAVGRIELLRTRLKTMQSIHKDLVAIIDTHDRLFGRPDPKKRPRPKLSPDDVKKLDKGPNSAGNRLLKVWGYL